ncbi:hypothetical protein [Ilumatobacter sp.]|uniref:hypothetical protein n=1 Tax=Ilumatobacter sp. TaxID=1967498 RepID=UPI003AF6EE01
MSDHDPSGGSTAPDGGMPTLPPAGPSIPPPTRPQQRPPAPPPRAAVTTLHDPVRAAQAEADRRARKRGVAGAIFVVGVLAATGAIGYVGYRRSQPGAEAVTEPTSFVEDYPSVRGGPRADDQMAEIDQAIDDAHGGEYAATVDPTFVGDRGPDSDAISVTNIVTQYESASADSRPMHITTEYDIDGDHLVAWVDRGLEWHHVVVTEGWVFRSIPLVEGVERRPRPAAALEPGPDLPLAGIVTPNMVLPDEARPFADVQSKPGDPVDVHVIDLVAFEAAEPAAAERWKATWSTQSDLERFATPGPVETADIDMSRLYNASFHQVGPHVMAAFTEPAGAGTFVAYQTGSDGAVIAARIVSYELDLRVEFLERRRVRGGYVPSVPDVEWN